MRVLLYLQIRVPEIDYVCDERRHKKGAYREGNTCCYIGSLTRLVPNSRSGVESVTKVSHETICQLRSAVVGTKHQAKEQVHILGGIRPSTTSKQTEAMCILAVFKVKWYTWHIIHVSRFDVFEHAGRFDMSSRVEERLLRSTCNS